MFYSRWVVFIRRVLTKSGATAVQVAEYSGGRQRIIKHVGSAHTDAELGVLLERARSLIAPAQEALDFEVELTPRVGRVRQVGGQGELFAPAHEQVVGRDGPGRVVSTDSVLLGQVLRVAYGQLGFDAVGDEVFRDLVIARIVEPTSKPRSTDGLTVVGGRGSVRMPL